MFSVYFCREFLNSNSWSILFPLHSVCFSLKMDRWAASLHNMLFLPAHRISLKSKHDSSKWTAQEISSSWAAPSFLLIIFKAVTGSQPLGWRYKWTVLRDMNDSLWSVIVIYITACLAFSQHLYGFFCFYSPIYCLSCFQRMPTVCISSYWFFNCTDHNVPTELSRPISHREFSLIVNVECWAGRCCPLCCKVKASVCALYLLKWGSVEGV